MSSAATWLVLVPIVISMVALVISAWNAWTSALRPARLQIDFNFIAIGNPGGGFCLVVPVTFSNTGARPATVLDVVLQEIGPEGRTQFTSWLTIKNHSIEAFFKTEVPLEDASPHIKSTSAAFMIPPMSAATHTIVFLPVSKDPSITDGAVLNYRVLARTAKREWIGERTLAWLNGTLARASSPGAILQVVEEVSDWRSEKETTLKDVPYRPGAMRSGRAFGTYSPHQKNPNKP